MNTGFMNIKIITSIKVQTILAGARAIIVIFESPSYEEMLSEKAEISVTGHMVDEGMEESVNAAGEGNRVIEEGLYKLRLVYHKKIINVAY